MLRLILLIACMAITWGTYNFPVAASSSSIVISHLQTGGAGSGTASQEFIALHNNAATDADVTNWCVSYSDYTDVSSLNIYCFKAALDADQVRIKAGGTVLFVSQTYPVVDTNNITARFESASISISGTRGHITLLDSIKNVMDRVAWDNGASAPPKNPETISAVAPAGGQMLVRNQVNSVYMDTDNNRADFTSQPSILPVISLLIDYIEPQPLKDLCSNIDDTQVEMPDNYDYDEAGNCARKELDACLNIDHVQLTVPHEYMRDVQGNCYNAELDTCENIEGFQMTIPSTYRLSSEGICKLIAERATIKITELLPNTTGSDIGHEFIELYNGNDFSVDLSDYVFAIGKTAEKKFALPRYVLEPASYIAFTDTQIGYTLLNTTSRVELRFYDDSLVDEIIPYEDPADDVSWALLDDTWQYTDVPTPATKNAYPKVLGTTDENTPTLIACPAGKYRNALTNRCRNIEEDAVLASCDVDEYRNPETNRCRKIVATTSALVPCAQDYERNPDTNRCRKITSESTMAACAEGYERNPDTNRCRKALALSTTAISENIERPESQNSLITSPFTLAATAGVGAVGYSVYEWRTELANGFRRLTRFIIKK